MASNPQQGGNPRPKPYEQAGTSSSSTPFRPPSSGRTSDVVEGSGTAKPGEVVPTTDRNTTVNRNSLGRPLPTRTWELNNGNGYGGNSFGGYGSGMNYSSGYGPGTYSSYGGFGGSYGGGGLYGNSTYRSPYGGQYGGSGLYGGGMYNSGFGGPMGGYGMGMGGPYGNPDPNNPFGQQPPTPPSFWVSFLHVMQGVVNFFGRIAILIDQNTQAFHMFMSALLQLFDRSGVLYGELARFVLRVLGIKTKPRNPQMQGPGARPGVDPHGQKFIEGPPGQAAPSGSWDNVWGSDGK